MSGAAEPLVLQQPGWTPLRWVRVAGWVLLGGGLVGLLAPLWGEPLREALIVGLGFFALGVPTPLWSVGLEGPVVARDERGTLPRHPDHLTLGKVHSEATARELGGRVAAYLELPVVDTGGRFWLQADRTRSLAGRRSAISHQLSASSAAEGELNMACGADG